jgi:hypothetical protein
MRLTMARGLVQLLLLAAAAESLLNVAGTAVGVHAQMPIAAEATTLVRGWSSSTSQGLWCDQTCLLSNAAKLLTPNMSLEVDPFMQITDSVWPTVVADGWWMPSAPGAASAIDAFGRPAPDPHRFPASGTKGLAAFCSALHGLRGTASKAGGLRCGVDLVLGVPRSAIAAASPVLHAGNATAATIANLSDPLDAHHFGINASAQGAPEYAQSLAQVMLTWRVDHVRVSTAGGVWTPRCLPTLRAFAVAFNRTSANKRTLAISGPSGSTVQPLLPGVELLSQLRALADSVAAGPPLWDTWPHLYSALSLAEDQWRRAPPQQSGGRCSGQQQQRCARWDIGALPIGRIGAVQDGNVSYPPWHAGSCTPAQLGCGDAVRMIEACRLNFSCNVLITNYDCAMRMECMSIYRRQLCTARHAAHGSHGSRKRSHVSCTLWHWLPTLRWSWAAHCKAFQTQCPRCSASCCRTREPLPTAAAQ